MFVKKVQMVQKVLFHTDGRDHEVSATSCLDKPCLNLFSDKCYLSCIYFIFYFILYTYIYFYFFITIDFLTWR